MAGRKNIVEDTLVAILVIVLLAWIAWVLSGCSVLTQRTAKVTYSKGCSITVEGMEVQKAAETARAIKMTDCATEINSGAQEEVAE